MKEISEQITQEVIKEAVISGEIPKGFNAKMLEDFQEYLKKDDELSEELFQLQEEYRVLVKQNEEEFDDLMKDMQIGNLVSKLQNLSDLAVKIGNIKAVNHYNNLITELQSSVTLDIMVSNLNKIKNPRKIVQQVNDNFNSEMKKFRTKLGSNHQYYFVDPIDLHAVLSSHVGKEISSIFLYSLSRFVNSKGQERVSKYSVFISQLIKNIYSLNSDDFTSKKELVESIEGYVADITA